MVEAPVAAAAVAAEVAEAADGTGGREPGRETAAGGGGGAGAGEGGEASPSDMGIDGGGVVDDARMAQEPDIGTGAVGAPSGPSHALKGADTTAAVVVAARGSTGADGGGGGADPACCIAGGGTPGGWNGGAPGSPGEVTSRFIGGGEGS